MKSILAPVFMICLLSVPTQASADVLLLDTIQQAPPNSSQGVSRPHRAMSMDQVRARFGEPEQQYPAVGKPPITRWVYERFTVYFEYNLVIETVVHRQ